MLASRTEKELEHFLLVGQDETHIVAFQIFVYSMYFTHTAEIFLEPLFI